MSVLNRIPLLLPEKILIETINQILQIIRDDYHQSISSGHENENILYLLLKNQSMGKDDLYADAVKILVTTPQDPTHIDCKLSFDQNSSKAPQLFLTQPSENKKNNSLSIGEGDQDELIITANDPFPDKYRTQYMRRYFSTYMLCIVCENRTTMLVLYNVLKMLLVSCTNNFILLGLSNFDIAGGSELVFRNEVPDRLFRKAISMSFEYEQVIPSLVIQNIFRKIRIFWLPEGASIPAGPIQIDESDDLSSSSSS